MTMERALTRALRGSPGISITQRPTRITSQWRRTFTSSAPYSDESKPPATETPEKPRTPKAIELPVEEKIREKILVQNIVDLLREDRGNRDSEPTQAEADELVKRIEGIHEARKTGAGHSFEQAMDRVGKIGGRMGVDAIPQWREEPEVKPKESELGYWGEGDEDQGPDNPFLGDDMTSIGHTELETHREMRHYARLAAWDLPLLSNLAKEFKPPPLNQPLRFRYTTYLGENHPAAHKVVVEFCPSDLPDLPTPARHKLIKLAGARYNPSSDIIKMSCEKFDTQLQNKRWLLDTVNALVDEAKNGKDSFADLPFDFRHHRPKAHTPFPEEWVLTYGRRRELRRRWAEADKARKQRLEEGSAVDGAKMIERALTGYAELPAGQKTPAELFAMADVPVKYSGKRRFKR